MLAALVVPSFARLILGFESLVYRDFSSFGYPLAFYHKQAFWRGSLPFWNPLNECGLPFLAQWNTLALYPPALVYLLLPLPWSLNLFCLGHMYLGGLGFFFLARRWTGNSLAAALAGVLFTFDGLVLNALIWPNVIAALAWAPWVIGQMDRAWREGGKQTAIAVWIASLQMLAGSPEVILLTWVLIGAVAIADPALRHSRPLLRFLAVIGLVAGLAAAQLLPFLELLRHSQRNARFGTSEWAMPLWGWGNFIVPLFHYYRSDLGVFLQHDQKWTSSYYLGVTAVLSALFALCHCRKARVWVLAGLIASALWLALGDAGQLFFYLRKICPPLSAFRFPVKFVVLPALAVPLLAAYGIAAWVPAESAGAPNRTKEITWWLLATLIMLLTGAILAASYRYPLPNERFHDLVQNAAGRIFFLLFFTACLLILPRTPNASARRILAFLLPLLAALDGLTHMPWQNPTVAPEVLAPGQVARDPALAPGQGRSWLAPEMFDLLSRNLGSDQVTNYFYHRFGLFPNSNLLDDIPIVDGFYSLELPEQNFISLLLRYSRTAATGGLLDFLGVARVLAGGPSGDWTNRATFLPWVTGGQQPAFASAGEIYQRLVDPAFDPRTTVYLPPEASIKVRAAPAKVEILEQRIHPERLEVELEASGPAMMVVAQAFYPCWRAFIDSQAVELWRANGAYQALQMPAGRHRVTLVYQDRAFWTGAAVSLGTLILTLAIFYKGRRSPAGL